MSNISEITSEFNITVWSQFIEKALKVESSWASILFSVLLCLIFIISLVGNVLTCVVIYYDRTMHTATNYYLFTLAVSDLIVTFAIPLEIYERLNNDSYQFGHLACKVHFFLVVVLWNNSILTMTALAVERYVAIWYPLLLKSTPVWRRVMKIIVSIWVVAIAETLPEIWTVGLIKTQKSSICFTVPTSSARIVNGVTAVLTFLLPLGIMTYVYAMIAFKVNVTQKTNSRDKIFNQRDNRSKVNKLIALTLSFLVCWLPFFTIRLIIFIYDMHQLMQLGLWWGTGMRVVTFNSWFSIVLNPLLFSMLSTKFRKALKALWDAKIRMQHKKTFGPIGTNV